MASLTSLVRVVMVALVRVVMVALVLVALGACTGSSGSDTSENAGASVIELADEPRRYSAEWLIDTSALDVDESVPSPFLYREVVDDQTGNYLVESPTHLALQSPTDVVLCAAVSRLPLDPYCASTPRADGAPNVLSYPIQIIRRDWGPASLYELASYREVSLVATSDPDSWSIQQTSSPSGFPIECFLATGETSAAATGFEVCFTDDDLHLVASVDLQNDLIFEIDLLSYERIRILEDFETGLDDFIDERPELQEQLLALYPEIPAPKPTPTPTPVDVAE